MAQTIPLEEPCDEIEGVEPGNPKLLADCDAGAVLNVPEVVLKEKAFT